MLMNELKIYKGSVDSKTVDTILFDIKELLHSEIKDKQLLRKGFRVCVECIENINRHEDGSSGTNSFSFGKKGGKLVLVTTNRVTSDAKMKLEKALINLSNTDKDEIKRLRLEQLKFGEFSDKGGASIGMMDVFINAYSVSFSFEDIGKGVYDYHLKTELICDV